MTHRAQSLVPASALVPLVSQRGDVSLWGDVSLRGDVSQRGDVSHQAKSAETGLVKGAVALRGFSLIEMMVALAISAVTIAVASSVAVSIGQSVTKSTRSVEADNEAKMLSEYIGSQMHGVGGATLRPWGAVSVQNAVGPNQSDRLVITELDDAVNLDCGIASHPGSSIAGNVLLTSTVDNSGSTPVSVCCFDGQNLAGLEVIITDEDGDNWEQAKIASSNSGNCRVDFTNSSANPSNRSFGASATVDFDNGSVLLVRTREFFLDAGDIFRVKDTLADGSVTTVDLSNQVRDFQVSLGYDVEPRDGRVVSSNDNSDEWLFNAAGDALGSGGLASATIQDMRRVAVGVVVYVPTTAGGVSSDAQILDGITHNSPNEFLRGAVSYITFRNSYIFR